MSDIPPEIIKEILSRLPAKSLLRFRCVSKPWRSMIDAKDFIKLHLRHSYETNSNRTLLVDSTQLFFIDLNSFERLDIGDIQFEPQVIASSCDGLVLIEFEFDNLVLWNPATRKSNQLPYPPLDCRITNGSKNVREQSALGYDSKHDDYKIVRVVQASTMVDDGFLYSETEIYSLRSNTWKKVECFPYMLSNCKSAYRWGVYLNDALHTVVNDSQRSEVIMAFNIAEEEHHEVPKPGVNCVLDSVEVMGGCLTAIVPGKTNSSEIWVMKEYGVKESWAKLLSFEPLPCYSRLKLNLCPLAYSKRGDEILLNYGRMCLIWYNLRTKTFSIAWVPGLTASFSASPPVRKFDAELCVASLVSPHSPAGMGDDFLSVGFKLVL
ncbi:hypothetical protein BUALT_Bualt03G0085700 [Buddleja alternifolia]|uniref:F-box domain-containing protein n=1 Tax=Buddleja alternifolia TaxID=168488 RepID=A0AAV6XYV0_9LAMI|nr:hypothetical protein BUALT_Bualt03G0085700 [Buddleja alternifolia]